MLSGSISSLKFEYVNTFYTAGKFCLTGVAGSSYFEGSKGALFGSLLREWAIRGSAETTKGDIWCLGCLGETTFYLYSS